MLQHSFPKYDTVCIALAHKPAVLHKGAQNDKSRSSVQHGHQIALFHRTSGNADASVACAEEASVVGRVVKAAVVQSAACRWAFFGIRRSVDRIDRRYGTVSLGWLRSSMRPFDLTPAFRVLARLESRIRWPVFCWIATMSSIEEKSSRNFPFSKTLDVMHTAVLFALATRNPRSGSFSPNSG